MSRRLLLRFSIKGISLIETLVGLAVFMIIAVSVYQAYTGLLKVFSVARVKIVAAYIGNEQIEIIRNLPYQNVGTVGGIPAGVLPPTQNITRDKLTFVVSAVIRNVDDPFDGTTKTTPRDLSPADYKLVQLDVNCLNCGNQEIFRLAARISPVGLETASTNGSLFVQVIDANGEPVSSATVQVVNNTVNPRVDITDTTGTDGFLKIVDAPPANQSYRITVSKSGYSTERTYAIDSQTPNPINPDATVALQQVTQVSFAIDRVSQINASSVTDVCASVGGVNFDLAGAKIINSDLVILKYSANHDLGASGVKTISNLEWDNYTVSFDASSNSNDLVGIIPPSPFNLIPNSTLNLKLVMKPENPNALLVKVLDSITRLPLSGASVTLSKSGYSNTLTTGRGSLVHTDWHDISCTSPPEPPAVCYILPPGSEENIQRNYFPGELRLATSTPSIYFPSGYLTWTFDTGSPSNFYNISWLPISQPPDTGLDSVKMQIYSTSSAIGLDPGTVTFRGPDGTSNTFYTLANQNINSIHNGDRYLSYKIYFSTASTTFTPSVSDVSLTFASQCVAPGQVFFARLDASTYNLEVNLSGYGFFQNQINVTSEWQSTEVLLIPQPTASPSPSPSPTPDGD